MCQNCHNIRVGTYKNTRIVPSTEGVLFGFAPERQSFCRQHLHPNPMKHLAKSTLLVLAAGFALSNAFAGPVEVDPAVPAYQQSSGVSGNLNSIGSDTLNNLMTFWAEGFKKVYPNVNIQIEGKGSTTAPPALIAGTAQLGPMSREMKSSEVDEFEKKFGYKPIAVKVAVDALAVFVNKDNPIKGLTLAQSGRYLFQHAEAWRTGHHDLGAGRIDRRLGEQTHFALRS